MKITGFPFFIFLLALAILSKTSPKAILHCIGLSLLGFWLANPINVDLYIVDIVQSNLNSKFALSFEKGRLQEMLFTERWAWDNVLTNSFSQMICSPYILFAIILVIGLHSIRIAAAVITFSLTSFYMVYTGQYLYAWYFFPFVPVLMFSLTSVEDGPQRKIKQKIVKTDHVSFFYEKFKSFYFDASDLKTRLIPGLLLIIIGINFSQTLPYSIFQANEKFQHIVTRKSYPTECVGQAIWTYKPTTLINKSEFEAKLPPIPPETMVLGAFGSNIGESNDRSMVLIGSRFIANPYHLQTMLRPGQALIKYGICDDIFIFVSK